MKHGLSMINAIRRSPAEIHTYNDGFANSMAFDIWLAGHKRHMSSTTIGMCHPPISALYGNAKQHREEADYLDKLAETTINLLAEVTGMSKEEAHGKFYADYKDHWISAEDAVNLGLIEEVETYQAAPLPSDPEKMSIPDLLSYFSKKGDQASKEVLKQLTNIKQRVIDALSTAPAKSTNIKEMKIEDLKKSLESGELTKEEVLSLMEEKAPEKKETPPDVDDDPDPAKMMAATLEEAVKPLVEKIDALEARLEEQGAKPAAAPTDVHKEKDPDHKSSSFDDTMKAWLSEAKRSGNPFTDLQ